MKVLHVDSARSWRGGQNQVLLTARGMARRGHEVTVACQSGGALESRAREAGLDVHPLVFHGDLSPGAVLPLARLLRSAGTEVAQFHDPHALTAGLVATLGGRTRLVATRRVDFAVRGPLSRWKYRRPDRVVAVSRAIASVLAEAGVGPDRVRVVYEGVADRPAGRGGAEALRGMGIPEGAPVVGNVAALTDHKDHGTLLRAAALVRRALPAVHFVVAGEGELRPQIEALRRTLGLEDVVHLIGFRTDIDRLLPAFTVFCLSSHLEGLGTSVLDAMAFGVPVVATAAGGLREAVDDGVTGRVVPVRDPAALAAALLDVLSSSETAARFGAEGRRRFQSLFTEDRMVDATLAVYEELR